VLEPQKRTPAGVALQSREVLSRAKIE